MFRSKRQRGYMYANIPDVAEKFERDTPKGAELPERIHPKKKRTKTIPSSRFHKEMFG